ncbi:hypothetical protein QFC19_004821 [Naganishia cerealis]|uniref:Uncharacterized protein n=1 Tax=Naganishia cerealis TaxID=610337 RepID=A0ACC2VT24_9TREE|nr:hypothetical protein QFC19_004821 [Naganishia cerealis]
MTARPVNRTVLGSNGQLGIGESIMLQEKARYEEFRRQHAKQNRDLVRVNTQRLEEIQSLKAEKDGLQAIILEERAEKAALASELKTLKKELAQVRSNSTREALDAILAVVPTLRQLREKLDTSSANSLERKRFDSVNRYVRVDPYEDRQFVAASGQTNLADLTERTERETDSDCGSTPGVLEHRIARLDLTVNRRRSVTAQERPMPPVRAEEAPAYTIPIPLQVEDQPAMPPRNRRISATKTPRASSISPETAAPVTPIVAMVETAVADVISATNPLITTTKRQRTSSAAATHVNPQTSSLLRPGKVESTENIRPRTSISAMVTLPPAKGKEEEVDLDGMEPTQSEKQDQWNRE